MELPPAAIRNCPSPVMPSEIPKPPPSPPGTVVREPKVSSPVVGSIEKAAMVLVLLAYKKPLGLTAMRRLEKNPPLLPLPLVENGEFASAASAPEGETSKPQTALLVVLAFTYT